MQKLSSLKASATRHVMVYGPPKSGKTLLVGKLAEKYNLIWFDLENGKDTLFQLPVEWQERITVISVPDTRANPVAKDTLLKVMTGRKVNICDTHGKCACMLCMKDSNAQYTELELNSIGNDTIVVFDSITQLTASIISSILVGMSDDYKFEFDDWAKLANRLDIFFQQVQNAPFNIVCISHENEVKVEDGKMKLVPVAGSTNYSRNAAKYFGDVIYTAIISAKHKAGSATLFSPNKLTGSRTGISIESMAEPSLIPIFTGEITETIPQKQQISQSLLALEAARAKIQSVKK